MGESALPYLILTVIEVDGKVGREGVPFWKGGFDSLFEVGPLFSLFS